MKELKSYVKLLNNQPQVVIVAGSDPDLWPDITTYPIDTKWIGVDRGTYYLWQKGIQPTLGVGDFDSLSKSELSQMEQVVPNMHYAKPEKDDTDTQLALALALEKYPTDRVQLIGTTGGRLDHFLSNLWLPLEPRFQPYLSQISLADKQNTIYYYQPGSYQVEKEIDKKYLAFICLTPVKDLTIQDAKYTLTRYITDYPISFASNEFVGEKVHFSFSSGFVAVIQSKDNKK